MNSDDFFRLMPSQGPIPADLYSDETGDPFQVCKVCQTPLRELSAYNIHKSYRGSECILELAICIPCSVEYAEGMSEESRRRLEELELEAAETREGSSRDGCRICARPREAFQNYAMAVLCRGQELLERQGYVCEECEHRVHEMLSAQTRGEMEDFIGRNFPGVPENIDVPGPVPSFL